MLEAFAGYKCYEFFTKNEKFENPSYGGNKKNDTANGNNYNWIFLIIYLLLIALPMGIAACYFSWTSNTLIEWGTGFKVLFAFFAFCGPLNYLLSHLIHKYDLLTYIEKEKTGTVFNNIQ